MAILNLTRLSFEGKNVVSVKWVDNSNPIADNEIRVEKFAELEFVLRSFKFDKCEIVYVEGNLFKSETTAKTMVEIAAKKLGFGFKVQEKAKLTDDQASRIMSDDDIVNAAISRLKKHLNFYATVVKNTHGRGILIKDSLGRILGQLCGDMVKAKGIARKMAAARIKVAVREERF